MQLEQELEMQFEMRHKEHLQRTRTLFSSYIERVKRTKSNLFISFTKWQESNEIDLLFNAKKHDLESGGYLLFLKGQGIAINPGQSFMKDITQSGYSLHDIDIVIATESYSSVEELFHLNRESNLQLASYAAPPHIIRFLLHPELMQSLIGHFRPKSRQEKESIVSLETFSDGEEELELVSGLTLAYMQTAGNGLAIRLEGDGTSLGYISHGGYLDAHSAFFSSCSLLIAGVGNTCPEDLEELTLQKDSLGYHGLKKLVEGAQELKVALLSEFSRSMGDIRIELTQKVQKDASCHVLPLHSGFSMHLDALAIQSTGRLATADDVRVVRVNGALMYVAEEDIC